MDGTHENNGVKASAQRISSIYNVVVTEEIEYRIPYA